MWGCEDVDQQMWGCEDILQRLLFYEEHFAGALGKNQRGGHWSSTTREADRSKIFQPSRIELHSRLNWRARWCQVSWKGEASATHQVAWLCRCNPIASRAEGWSPKISSGRRRKTCWEIRCWTTSSEKGRLNQRAQTCACSFISGDVFGAGPKGFTCKSRAEGTSWFTSWCNHLQDSRIQSFGDEDLENGNRVKIFRVEVSPWRRRPGPQTGAGQDRGRPIQPVRRRDLQGADRMRCLWAHAWQCPEDWLHQDCRASQGSPSWTTTPRVSTRNRSPLTNLIL